MLITANQPFGQWEAIFPDRGMTVAAIDRFVHRASIFELNVDSYRRRTAIEDKRTPRRPEAASTATDQADSSSQEDRGRLTPPHSPPPSIQTALGPKSALPAAAAEKTSSIAAPQRVFSPAVVSGYPPDPAIPDQSALFRRPDHRRRATSSTAPLTPGSQQDLQNDLLLSHPPARCDTGFSHLDCRSVLILIVAPQLWTNFSPRPT